MLLIKTDVSFFVIIAHAIRVYCYQANCNNSSPLDNVCLNLNSAQEATSVLRKCCPSGQSYVARKRTCAEKNETAEFDTSVFDFLAGASGFERITFGMPNCSEVLVDFALTPDSFEEISNKEYTAELMCVDREAENDSLIGKRCLSARENCGKFSCVRKCCPPGKNMKGKSCARNDSGRGFNPAVFDLADTARPREMDERRIEVGVIHGNCPGKKYPVKTQFYLAENGMIFVPDKNKFFPQTDYCLEDVYLPEKKMDGITAFLCFKKENAVAPQEIDTRFVLTLIGLIISCFFLLATLLVYALLPDLQNIHGLTLMCEVSSFLLAFLSLILIQLTFGRKDVNRAYCHFLACTLYFAILASFTWMNIMCFDIWWTIGGVWKTHSSRGRKRLVWYSMYAWGCPMLVTLFAVGVDTFDSLSSMSIIVKPDLGTDTCWFPSKGTTSKSELMYFIIPMSLSILCNITLFALTVRSLLRVKRDVMRVQQSSKEHSKRKLKADKKSFIIACKLFVVMGLSWLVEGVAYFTPDRSSAWFYVPDAFNTLRGVLIFIIFVCKKSVLNSLADKFGCPRIGTRGARSSGATKSSETSATSTCFGTEDALRI